MREATTPPGVGPDAGGARGRGRRLGLAVVTGDSMLPGLRSGDRLLVVHGGRVSPGRLVVARFPDGTLAVKRAVERRTARDGSPAWWLLSDNPDRGVDSRHRGPVRETEVLAVVRARLWPMPRLV